MLVAVYDRVAQGRGTGGGLAHGVVVLHGVEDIRVLGGPEGADDVTD